MSAACLDKKHLNSIHRCPSQPGSSLENCDTAAESWLIDGLYELPLNDVLMREKRRSHQIRDTFAGYLKIVPASYKYANTTPISLLLYT